MVASDRPCPAIASARSAFDKAGLTVSSAEGGDGAKTGFVVRGDTYPHREMLKAAGGRWSKSRGGWLFAAPLDLERLADRLDRYLAEPAANHGQGGVHSMRASSESRQGLAEAPARFKAKPHYLGHRQRLRDRFLDGGAEALPDYELLELLLFFSIPKVDVKPLAKQLLADFGSLGALLAADPDRLQKIEAISHFTLVQFKVVHQLLQRVLGETVRERPLIGSAKALLDYLRLAIGHEHVEQFRLLFLDQKHRLIKDELQQRGTVDQTPIFPREVAKRALDLGATGVIMVHNHPSGDPTPSRADIEMTRQISRTLAPLQITLHDHLILSPSDHLSFKAEEIF